MRILITGGAGFVGGALARWFLRCAPGTSVVVVDNLRRRGSESNVAGLSAEGVCFVHGDVRNRSDLETLEGNFDVMIEASAEPSVHAGIGISPRYVLDTNLLGAVNCLEFARERCGGLVFLSSSRVYSIQPLRALALAEQSTRLDLPEHFRARSGVGFEGITEDFACAHPGSYYGASKGAAEMVCREYAAHAGLPIVINRCGVIAGAGQFGKTDQGVFTLWVARHHYGRTLKYTGFGGKGMQVRDLLHPDDLGDLVALQIAAWPKVSGHTFNVGGGRRGSVSLREFTNLCRERTGTEVVIDEDPSTSVVDIPWYITDHRRVSELLGWKPSRSPRQIVAEVHDWILANEQALSGLIV